MTVADSGGSQVADWLCKTARGMTSASMPHTMQLWKSSPSLRAQEVRRYTYRVASGVGPHSRHSLSHRVQSGAALPQPYLPLPEP